MPFPKGIPISWVLAALLTVAVLANALLLTRWRPGGQNLMSHAALVRLDKLA